MKAHVHRLKLGIALVTPLLVSVACRDADRGPTAALAPSSLADLAGMLDGVGYSYACEDEEFATGTVRTCTCDAANEVFFYSLWACLCSFDCEPQDLWEAGGSSAAFALLVQEGRPRPAEELDAFADRMVEAATGYRDGDSQERQRLAVGARDVLAQAATADRGVPYPGSLERLERIVRDARDPGIGLGALAQLTRLPEEDPVAAFLGEIAASPDTTDAAAPFATLLLVNRVGDAGGSVLRRLFETGAVVHPKALVTVNSIAYHEGWDR